MPSATRNRERKERLSGLCLDFPAATCEDTGHHSAFRCGGKVFAYLLDNHHGDGILSVCCKALPGDNHRLIEANPRRFYLPAYIGPRGWVALRLDLPSVDWSEVKELLRGSYLLIAPKKYTRQLDP